MTAPNNCSASERVFHQIYPLNLINEPKSWLLKELFLELMVTINGRECYAKLLDKRDNFPYLIAHMPNVDVDMLNKVV